MTTLNGKKMIGFQFDSIPYVCHFVNKMKRNIGQVGTIVHHGKDTVKVKFGEKTWTYPLELVNDYLVEE